MARQSKNDSARLAEYRKKLQEVKKAEAAVQRQARELDLKIKNLKKRIAEVPFHPFIPSPGAAGSRRK
jgi:phage shock protein A